MAQKTKFKIQAVHHCLDAFEIRVLARPAPTINMNTLQEVVASLCVDVDAILDVSTPETEAAPTELAEDTILVALFTTTTALLPPPLEGTNPATPVRVRWLGLRFGGCEECIVAR